MKIASTNTKDVASVVNDMKTNKYKYLLVLQQNWCGRWEDICRYPENSDGKKSAKSDLRCYIENQPQIPIRIIHRRELIAKGGEKH